MFITSKVEISLKILNVLKRADVEYVPACVIERVHGEEVSLDAIQDVLHHLRKYGILESRLGFYGGYKHVKPVTILELMEIFCPTKLPDPDNEKLVDPLPKCLRKVRAVLSKCSVVPQKTVPLDYMLDDDDVETASTDAHGPMEGQP